MISITLFNFLTLLKLVLLGKKLRGFVYLRSDGFLEYKIRYGFLGYYFYYLMFLFIKKRLKFLSVSSNFTFVKVSNILHPSELTDCWFKKKKTNKKFKTDFLYVGRFKKEKGVHFLARIFKKHLNKYKLTIVGTKRKFVDKHFYNKNIKFIGPINNAKKLIDIYDSSRVFILPSFTEGFPKVISESLVRLRPIIIFDEIKHVLNKRKGIYVCKREMNNIKKKIDFIFGNYGKIQKMMRKNTFHTKNNFKKELLKAIKNEFKN